MEKKKKKLHINWKLLGEYALKTLHVIGYIAIGLLITLSIAMGVNSCANKADNKKSGIRQSNDISEKVYLNDSPYYKYYWSNFSDDNLTSNTYSEFTLSFETQSYLWSLCFPNTVDLDYVFDRVLEGQPAPSNMNCYFYDDNLYCMLIDNTYYKVSRVGIWWQYYYRDTYNGYDYYLPRIESFRFTMENNNGVSTSYRPIRNYGSTYDDYTHYRAYSGYATSSIDPMYYRNCLITGLNVKLPEWVTYFYDMYTTSSNTQPNLINFELSSFNPNYYFGARSDRTDIYDSYFQSNLLPLTLTPVENTYFISNGRFFNRIVVQYIKQPAGDTLYQTYDDTGELKTFRNLDDESMGFFGLMRYENTFTGDYVVVCRRPEGQLSVTLGLGQVISMRGPLARIDWVDEEYKHIQILPRTFYDNAGVINIVLQDMNSGINTQTETNFDNFGGVGGDVFTLISSTFASLLPILSFTIVPGVTIGVILAVPLIGMVVFAIVKLLRK